MSNLIFEPVKGYKIFNPDWTCRDFKYEVGKTYKTKLAPNLTRCGFHFCKKAVNCFSYYSFNSNNHVAEVVALGDTMSDDDLYCTNKIKIVRELSWHEVLDLVNVGEYNTGQCNTGAGNSGHYNAGDYNSGNFNTGNYNSGFLNTGNYNSGRRNSGWVNSGWFNSGNWNLGDYNSGDWNKSDHNSGCFNTTNTTLRFFNKESNWDYETWVQSDACKLLEDLCDFLHPWIDEEEMTDEEKIAHPEYKVRGGFYDNLDTLERRQWWWHDLTSTDKEAFYNLPNFDAQIFRECTAIDVNKR